MAAAVEATTQSFEKPWVEKYRPLSLNDVVCHDDIISTVKRFIDRDQLPHLLLHGPPGTGKTSTAFAIAKTLFGDSSQRMVLELNASDDRGINVVRESIKTFAKTCAVTWSGKRTNTGLSDQELPATGSSKIKLVILDEADQMTRDAQNALRRIMEKYAEHVRFCIMCNIVNKINPAIQSRCTKFRFSPLSIEHVRDRVLYIAQQENTRITENAIQALLKSGKGDMRKVLNMMQSAAMGNESKELNESLVLRCLGLPLQSEIDEVFECLAASSFEKSVNLIRRFQTAEGYALQDIVEAVYQKALSVRWPAPAALVLFPRLADIEYRLSQGVNESIEVSALVSAFVEIRRDLEAMRGAGPS